ncbi:MULTISPECIES: hypothetical protein [unclassified Imperialibacter]|uniref:hypothetical protein n=1 Tax=unclassified Imperialibacter TaxID=2629706 RepID=UPI00125A0253|nr:MULTISPECIES: hypothetical protein [unclassified Imperialibacter]CAD5265290.1 conserved membrane hypothetical protein [Imperialibacter sp. 89]CAD5270168.1 conserved membrane hypothetical protein [Imperialibacter sp. 75]VVT09784.1 conserved membrane hypothetical protein [Imperialibacter sp. EC-SDR9]
MKSIRLFLIIVCSLIVFQAEAQIQAGETVIIREKIEHDLYVAGGSVTINAPVLGDLIVAGGSVTVNDTISQDILAAGGEIFFNGYVGDDIRCAGGTISISGNIAGDLVVAGGTVAIDDKVVVDGNLFTSGGEITLNGEVAGILKSASGKLTLNGSVGGDIDCRGGDIIINGPAGGNAILAATTLELGPDASFAGNVNYWNEAGHLDFQNTVQGTATFDPSLEIEDGKWEYLGFASVLMVIWYLGTALVMILLIRYLFSNTLNKAAATAKESSLNSLGLGFLFLIGVPVAIVLSMVTLIGAPIGVLALTAYLTVVLLATVIVSIVLAYWLNQTYYKSAWKSGKVALVAFGLFILLKFISITPFVGPLSMLLLMCVVFGAILLTVSWKKEVAV